jgi:hypothetical protein
MHSILFCALRIHPPFCIFHSGHHTSSLYAFISPTHSIHSYHPPRPDNSVCCSLITSTDKRQQVIHCSYITQLIKHNLKMFPLLFVHNMALSATNAEVLNSIYATCWELLYPQRTTSSVSSSQFTFVSWNSIKTCFLVVLVLQWEYLSPGGLDYLRNTVRCPPENAECNNAQVARFRRTQSITNMSVV